MPSFGCWLVTFCCPFVKPQQRETHGYRGLWVCHFELFFSHQILDAVVVEVSAALREATEQDLDETLVPGWTHGQETVLQQHVHTTVTTLTIRNFHWVSPAKSNIQAADVSFKSSSFN